jgi:hypothetical protein
MRLVDDSIGAKKLLLRLEGEPVHLPAEPSDVDCNPDLPGIERPVVQIRIDMEFRWHAGLENRYLQREVVIAQQAAIVGPSLEVRLRRSFVGTNGRSGISTARVDKERAGTEQGT